MERLLSYLGKEARGEDIFWLIWNIVIAALLWSLSVAFFLTEVLGISLGDQEPIEIPLPSWYTPLIIFLVIFALAYVEEVAFRFIPLSFGVRRWGVTKRVLLAAGLSSVLFGLAHGSLYNIPIQGVSGFLFSCVFLKCGGFQGKYLKALLFSTLTHFTYNSILVLALLIGGGGYF